jgi:hypothetical protein
LEDVMKFLVEFDINVPVTPLAPHPNDPAPVAR